MIIFFCAHMFAFGCHFVREKKHKGIKFLKRSQLKAQENILESLIDNLYLHYNNTEVYFFLIQLEIKLMPPYSTVV